MRLFSRLIIPAALIACLSLLGCGQKAARGPVRFKRVMAEFTVARKGMGDIVEVRLSPDGASKPASIDIDGGDQLKTPDGRHVLVLAEHAKLPVSSKVCVLRAFSLGEPVAEGKALVPANRTQNDSLIYLMRQNKISVNPVKADNLKAYQLAVWAMGHECQAKNSTQLKKQLDAVMTVPSTFGDPDYHKACTLLGSTCSQKTTGQTKVPKAGAQETAKSAGAETYESALAAADSLLQQAQNHITDRNRASGLVSEANAKLATARSLGGPTKSTREQDLIAAAVLLQQQLGTGRH